MSVRRRERQSSSGPEADSAEKLAELAGSSGVRTQFFPPFAAAEVVQDAKENARFEKANVGARGDGCRSLTPIPFVSQAEPPYPSSAQREDWLIAAGAAGELPGGPRQGPAAPLFARPPRGVAFGRRNHHGATLRLPGPKGGCRIAPLGAQLVRRVHPVQAWGSKRAGGAQPGLPGFAGSSLQRRKASGFWRESLGASPDFYGNQEGGVKPLSSAFLPPPSVPQPPSLPAPRVCQIFRLIISPELQSAASDSHLSGRAGWMRGALGNWVGAELALARRKRAQTAATRGPPPAQATRGPPHRIASGSLAVGGR
ncbi:hypothetical protein HPG69_008388 [Diceros bicornis minor]|uniref:Uncharacterized protein n=1 Tax=Diceros bicornis minor TaxID=77932 RepID=A0A7J7EPE9_DICBM|nr:hypothetical protein HPG69_008388 [Diceros bicornis minor]